MLIDEKFNYLLADREFYEPLDRYRPLEQDFCRPLARYLPPDWRLEHRNLWYDCSWPAAELPAQGWKIHISATLSNSQAILVTVARILFAARVPFKFVADRSMLMMVNGKRWQRGGAGKFITLYPSTTEQCGQLLEVLHQALIGYQGPLILSDRRYRDSRNVHYRYGGITPVKRVGADGKSVLIISDGAGGYLDDERNPYFKLPEGMEDPFLRPEAIEDDQGEPGTLKNGRYQVRAVLAFSNSGGVYLAFDRETSKEVVIKEARPFTNISVRGLDAPRLLKKEYRLLEVMADTGIAPKPLDFFFDWEHAYSVQEYLENSISLRGFLTGLNLALRTRADAAYSREFYRKYTAVFGRIARMLKVLHDRQIVFSDLSLMNVMVLDKGGEELRLIDFEGGYEEGVDVPTHLYTLGFSPEELSEKGLAVKEDDYYGLGSLMLAGIFPMNSLLSLNRKGYEAYLKAFQDDFDFPAAISDLIGRLLDGKADRRPKPEEVIEVLGRTYEPEPPRLGTRELDAVDPEAVLGRILSYIDSVASFDRSDRLYPADPIVFQTNPLSLGHGACGVAYVSHRIRGQVDTKVLDWIRARKLRKEAYPPGLYVGLSGIAWCLLEMGLEDEARSTLDLTHDHHVLWRSCDLFNGVSGWGLAQLRFFLATGDEAYLDRARQVGKFLLERRRLDPVKPGRSFWETDDGSAGLAHGVAGISLFLLYLSLATGHREYLEVGQEGVEWVADRGRRNTDQGLTWIATEASPAATPYWRWGSSGIGRVLLRYWQVTGEKRYASAIDHIHIDCDRKYAIFPGYFFGLSGIVDFYQDIARFERWTDLAQASSRKLLSGCLLMALERESGLAFPGESLSRISCDFGTGSAGIALMFHRMLTGCQPSFMLDELMPAGDPVESETVPAGELVAAT